MNASTFDLKREGKHTYSLASLCLDTEQFGDDTLTCIRHGEGPCVVICGGIHGDEYEPQLVLRRLAASIAPHDVKGTLCIIPSLNFPASQHGKRVADSDGLNMNRAFPGMADGTPTQRLAAFLNERLFPDTDLLIDVHAGGGGCTVVPMVFGWTSDNCALSPDALDDLMEKWGYPYVQHVPIVDSTSCGAALRAGVPSVEIEGGGGTLRAAETELMRAGLLRGLAAYGVLNRSDDSQPFVTSVHLDAPATGQYVAPCAGVLEHKVRLHETVTAGQVVALVHPLTGADVPQPVRSERPGIVLRLSTAAFVSEGAFIGNTGTPR